MSFTSLRAKIVKYILLPTWTHIRTLRLSIAKHLKLVNMAKIQQFSLLIHAYYLTPDHKKNIELLETTVPVQCRNKCNIWIQRIQCNVSTTTYNRSHCWFPYHHTYSVFYLMLHCTKSSYKTKAFTFSQNTLTEQSFHTLNSMYSNRYENKCPDPLF